MTKPGPFDGYLRKKAPGRGIFRLLKAASREMLRGKSAIDEKTDADIGLVAAWLAAERDRDAPWLKHTSSEGVPLRLSGGFSDAFNAAQKWRARGPGKTAPDLSRLPPGKLHCSVSGAKGALAVATDEQWNLFTRRTRDAFFKEMTAGLPHGTNLNIVINRTGRIQSLEYINGEHNNENIIFRRSFDNTRKLAHDLGDYVTTVLRHQGVYRQATANLIRFCREIGIGKLKLGANYAGAYAHARMGYVPDEDDWKRLRRQCEKRLSLVEKQMDAMGRPLPPALTAALRGALAEDDPKNFWFVVDQEYLCGDVSLGQALTLPVKHLPKQLMPRDKARRAGIEDLYWNGTLDLKDADCSARYTAYLSGTKAPALRRRRAPSAKPETP